MSKVWREVFCNAHQFYIIRDGKNIWLRWSCIDCSHSPIFPWHYRDRALALRAAILVPDVPPGWAPELQPKPSPAPLSKFHTRPQARLGISEAKMAVRKSRRSYGKILMWRVQKLNGPISKLSEKVKELCVWLLVYCHRHPELPPTTSYYGNQNMADKILHGPQSLSFVF